MAYERHNENLILASARLINAKRRLVRREQRLGKIEAKSAKNRALGTAKTYSVILADPPWKFEAGDSDRSTENHYPTMTRAELLALRVRDIAAKDAVLFMWATSPFLSAALDLMELWGFTYKSHIIWVKPKIGLGFWVRSKHELLLIGTCGSIPAPLMGTQPQSVIEAPAGVHSAKPEVFMEMVENLYPTLGKIELFSRAPRLGWDAWGNEVE
jgi:N6-adenosine-specific RNA methylase IME4